MAALAVYAKRAAGRRGNARRLASAERRLRLIASKTRACRLRAGAAARMDPRDIASLIEQNLAGASAHVETDGQGHYEATVIASAFAGKRSLQRHQLVYATLGARVGNEIHALALKTYPPEEGAERGK